jgi:hypothetical protein
MAVRSNCTISDCAKSVLQETIAYGKNKVFSSVTILLRGLGGSGVALGVMDGFSGLQMALGAAAGLKGSWVDMGGCGWLLGIAVAIGGLRLTLITCQILMNAPNFTIKTDTESNRVAFFV